MSRRPSRSARRSLVRAMSRIWSGRRAGSVLVATAAVGVTIVRCTARRPCAEAPSRSASRPPGRC
jgi:hypothetical protein